MPKSTYLVIHSFTLLSESLKCESGSSRFQPGEGPSRGLLRNSTTACGTDGSICGTNSDNQRPEVESGAGPCPMSHVVLNALTLHDLTPRFTSSIITWSWPRPIIVFFIIMTIRTLIPHPPVIMTLQWSCWTLNISFESKANAPHAHFASHKRQMKV